MFRFIGMNREGPLDKEKYRAEVYRTVAWLGLWFTMVFGGYAYGRYNGITMAQNLVVEALESHTKGDIAWRASVEERMTRFENKMDHLIFLSLNPDGDPPTFAHKHR